MLDRLNHAVQQHSLVGVIGASGSGKSSLVLAGLVGCWKGPTLVVRPGGSAEGTRLAMERFVFGHRADYLPIRDGLEPHDGSPPRLLVVDQLEDLFSTDVLESTRAAFIESLCAIADVQGQHVVVTLRSDHYGSCARYGGFALAISNAHLLLGMPSPANLRSIVTEPPARAGIAMEAELVEAVLADVAEQSGALPLLSHALQQTWERSDGSTLTLAGYQETGGVRGAIAATAEKVWGRLDGAQQQVARDLLIQFVGWQVDGLPFGEGGSFTTRSLNVAEIVPVGAADRQLVFEHLVRARIVTVDAGAARIAHEAIFREWPRLRDWLSDNRASQREIHRIHANALDWSTNDEEPALLLRGRRLTSAAELPADSLPSGSLLQRYISSSLAAVAAEQRKFAEDAESARVLNRKLKRLVGSIAVALACTLIAGVLAVAQWRSADEQRKRAHANGLAAIASTVRNDQIDLAALLAVESRRERDDRDAQGALFGVMNERPGLRAMIPYQFISVEAVVDSTGRYLATIGDLNPIEVFDISGPTPKLVKAHKLDEAAGVFPYRMEFLNSGDLAVGDDSGGVSIIDPNTGTFRMRSDQKGEGGIWGLDVSPDQQLVAAGGDDGLVRVFDAETGRSVTAPLNDGTVATIQSVAFSPDGSVLAAGGDGGVLSLWDTKTWKQSTASVAVDSVWSLGWSPDGSRLAVGTASNAIVLDTKTDRQIGPPFDSNNGIIYRVKFLKDGNELALSGENGRVQFRDPVTHLPTRPDYVGHSAGVRADINEKRNVMVTASDDTKVAVWDLRGATNVAKPFESRSGAPAALATFTRADGVGGVVGVDSSGDITTWDNDGTRKSSMAVNKDLSDVGVSEDGSVIAASATDGSVLVLTNGKVTGRYSAGKKSEAVALSPDGRWLATANASSDCEACTSLFDLSAPGKPPRMIRSKGLKDGVNSATFALAFSRDSRLLATGARRGFVDLVEVATGEVKWVEKTERGVRSLAFSPDGTKLAAGGNTGSLVIFMVASGKRSSPLLGHRGEVGGLAFNSDSTLLASTAATDGSLRIWRMDTNLTLGRAVYTGVTEMRSPAWLSAEKVVSPHRLVGAMEYTLDPENLAAAACHLAMRNITSAEWASYLPDRQQPAGACEPAQPGKIVE